MPSQRQPKYHLFGIRQARERRVSCCLLFLQGSKQNKRFTALSCTALFRNMPNCIQSSRSRYGRRDKTQSTGHSTKLSSFSASGLLDFNGFLQHYGWESKMPVAGEGGHAFFILLRITRQICQVAWKTKPLLWPPDVPLNRKKNHKVSPAISLRGLKKTTRAWTKQQPF